MTVYLCRMFYHYGKLQYGITQRVGFDIEEVEVRYVESSNEYVYGEYLLTRYPKGDCMVEQSGAIYNVYFALEEKPTDSELPTIKGNMVAFLEQYMTMEKERIVKAYDTRINLFDTVKTELN